MCDKGGWVGTRSCTTMHAEWSRVTRKMRGMFRYFSFRSSWMDACGLTDRLRLVGVSFLAELSVRSCVVISSFQG